MGQNKKRSPFLSAAGLLCGIGIATCSAGIALIYVPAALIAGGVGMCAVGLLFTEVRK